MSTKLVQSLGDVNSYERIMFLRSHQRYNALSRYVSPGKHPPYDGRLTTNYVGNGGASQSGPVVFPTIGSPLRLLLSATRLLLDEAEVAQYLIKRLAADPFKMVATIFVLVHDQFI